MAMNNSASAGRESTAYRQPVRVFPAADGGSVSLDFFVQEMPVVVKAFNLPAGARVKIEMIDDDGCGGTVIGPLILGCCQVCLGASNPLAAIPLPGRYRAIMVDQSGAPITANTAGYGDAKVIAVPSSLNQEFLEAIMGCGCNDGSYIETLNGSGVGTTLQNPTIAGGTIANASMVGGTIQGSSLVNVQIGKDCNGNAIMSGDQLARCSDIPSIPTITMPTTLPPSGPASGELTGSYPNPNVISNLTLGKSCSGADVKRGDVDFVKCADLAASVAQGVADANAHSDARDATQDATISALAATIAAKQGQLLDCNGNNLAPGTKMARCSDIPAAVDVSGKQDAITTLDEGAATGLAGSVTSINFAGAGVTASQAGSVLTVTVPGASGGASGAAGGDLSGTYPNPTVDGLQGVSISATAPAAGQILRFDGASWTPYTPPDPANTIYGILNNASGNVPGGTYAGGASGQLTSTTTISNASTTKTKRLTILSGFARVNNPGSNTASIGAQGKVQFGAAAQLAVSFAGSASPGDDAAGGTFMGTIPTYDIPPGGSVTVTNIAEWSINSAGAVNAATALVQAAATYVLAEI